MRQWVLSLPKRWRYFLHHDTRPVNAVAGIFLAEVEAALKACSPDTPTETRFGAVSFSHRFGSALNAHLHFHCCAIDGVFSAVEEEIRFHPTFLTDVAIAPVQRQTRRRVLKLFQRRELLPEDATEMMRGRQHGGGFSLNAEVWVPLGSGRPGTPPEPATGEPTPTRTAHYLWAALIARIYQVLPLIGPECGGEMRLIAFITEAEPLRRILAHLDEPVRPPPISPARPPPDQAGFDLAPNSANDPERVDPAPEFEFDRTVSW